MEPSSNFLPSISMIGVSFKTVPLEKLEEVSRNIPAALGSFVSVDHLASAILATCNRVEVYHSGDPLLSSTISVNLSRECDIDKSVFYSKAGDDAISHLFQVAAGLDSMAIGEEQIAIQVRRAKIIGEWRPSRVILEKLFRAAYLASSNIRKKAGITRSQSIGAVAVNLLKERTQREGPIIVVGAGKNATEVLKTLSASGAEEIFVVNRTKKSLGRPPPSRIITRSLEELPGLIRHAGGLIVATSSPTYIIDESTLKHLESSRQKLVIIDLSIPRNVDPKISTNDGVELYNLSDIANFIRTVQQPVDTSKASDIIEEEVARFKSWLARREIEPILRSIRLTVEKLRTREVSEALRRLNGKRANDRQVIETMSTRIVNKILHTPTAQLRAVAAQGRGQESIAMARELFLTDG